MFPFYIIMCPCQTKKHHPPPQPLWIARSTSTKNTHKHTQKRPTTQQSTTCTPPPPPANKYQSNLSLQFFFCVPPCRVCLKQQWKLPLQSLTLTVFLTLGLRIYWFWNNNSTVNWFSLIKINSARSMSVLCKINRGSHVLCYSNFNFCNSLHADSTHHRIIQFWLDFRLHFWRCSMSSSFSYSIVYRVESI